jgi:hypothetical protein
VDRLTLARRCAGRTVRQQVVDAERFGVGVVGVQRMHQRRPFLDDSHSRMAMAVDPTLMPLGQAEPALQIQIVVDMIQGVTARKEAGAEAPHQAGHVLVDRITVAVEAGEERVEVGLTPGGFLRRWVQGRGHFLDRLDVAPDRLLLGFHQVQSLVDAGGQSAQLLLREPPFFASTFRWIDCRTSSNASAIRNPGGSSGPPWSLLRMPRTAAQ